MKLTYLTVAGSERTYRITIESPVMIPMTRRVRRPAAEYKRSKRISSLSFTTKAAPQSTSHSQVMTLSSEVQPTGKLNRYRKTICTMKATNMAASRPAAKFSARRSSQAPAFPKNGFIVLLPPRPAGRRPRARPAGIRELLQGVDLLEHPFRPVLRLVRAEVCLLRIGAEGIDVRGVDFETLLPEAIGQLRFALQVLGRAPGDRLVGRSLEGLLLGGRHALPGFQVDAEQVVSDEVRGQHDLRHHLVELHVLHVGQRVVLAVDRSGLQPRINLGVSHGRGIRANRAAKELPRFAGRHPELDAGHVGRGVDFLLGFQADLPRAEERRSEDFHLDVVLDHLLHLRAEIAGKEGIQMVGVAEQVRRSQDRP